METVNLLKDYFQEIGEGEVEITLFHFSEIKNIEETFLFPIEQAELALLKNQKRQREFCAIRCIRNRKNLPFPILYSAIGAPYFNEIPKKISISHSKELAVFAISPFKVGVDVEPMTERIIKIKDRFTTSSEIGLFNFNQIKTCTIIWTIKEVLYKLSGLKNVDFLKEMRIINVKNNQATCQFMTEYGQRHVKIKFHEMANFIISFNPLSYYES